MIMAARVHAGWIKPEDLEQPAPEAEPETAPASDAGVPG
jgi:N utilization substance protein A